ncbi:MAG TPA: hypothetical protein VLU95_01855 [Candidatus Acidoferrum sp.]|nr:hypothetical protein [Candidatus Acidoferrum sp.]
MKKSLLYVLVALTLVSIGLAVIPTVFSQTQNVKIVNYSYYVDNQGILDVVGQVQNVGSNPVDPVVLTGIIYGSDGSKLSASYAYVWAKYLSPQQYAPFYMEFQPPQSSNGWDLSTVSNVSLTVVQANATSSYEYTGLTVASSTGTVGTVGDYNGAYVVNGVIQNAGGQTATNLTVVATFFNAKGDVVAVGNTYGSASSYVTPSLSPSGTIAFQVAAWDRNQSEVSSDQKIANYWLLLQAQGPVLQGNAPSVTPYSNVGISSGSSNTPLSTNGAINSNTPSNSTLIYALVVVVVVVAIAGTLIVFRRRKPQTETVVVPKKAKSRRER